LTRHLPHAQAGRRRGDGGVPGGGGVPVGDGVPGGGVAFGAAGRGVCALGGDPVAAGTALAGGAFGVQASGLYGPGGGDGGVVVSPKSSGKYDVPSVMYSPVTARVSPGASSNALIV